MNSKKKKFTTELHGGMHGGTRRKNKNSYLELRVLRGCPQDSIPPSYPKDSSPPWLIFLFFFVVSLSFVSCSTRLPVCELAIEREGQQIALVKAEIARTHEERNNGLMYRKKLPDGEGMLFVFEKDEIMTFWMKNTLIPLSIAYIASDGRIIDIKDMYPHDETSVSSSRSVRYALEVPHGWFSGVGVKNGDIVNVDIALKNSRK